MSKHKEKLNEILDFIISQKASDGHISVDKPLVIRVNSILKFTNTNNFSKEDVLGIVDNLLTFYQQEKLTKNKSINFSYTFKNKDRFRINVFFQKRNISIALRHIPNKVKAFEELYLPEELRDVTKLKQGLVLITGPTGQGKSTTLAALINEINNTRNNHIITIEDPIEFIFKDNKSIITQREIFEDTNSFNDALKDTFRQDPDVIMVGEIRDYETMSTAITAGETGHLVLGTLHTNSAAQTVDRIIDSFPAGQQNQIKSQLSSCLSCVFSQRLIQKINGELTIAYELMYLNAAIANLIREGIIHRIPSVIGTSKANNMISLNNCLVKMIINGEIDKKTAFKTSLDVTELKMLLG